MGPILELNCVVVGKNILDLQSIRPGINQPLLRSFEVILNVTLAADEAAHLLSGSIAVHVVVLDTGAGLKCPHSFDETGSGDAKLHRLRIMAINAGDRMV